MAKIKILVVEDEVITAKGISSALKSMGYTVSGIASSGEEAIQKTSEVRPDLVLMDIKLQGEMDGIEAAGQIKDRFSIPVVYLTAHADDATLARAMVTDPYGYILKPFEDRDLHIGIEIALFKHKMEVKLKESEEKFRGVVTSVFDAIIMMDDEGKITFWNEAAEKMFGYPEEEVIGKDLHKFIVPERFYEDYLKGLKRFKKGGTGGLIGKIIFMHGLKKDGTEILIDHSFSSVNIKGKWQAISVIRDITERKRVENALSQSREQIQSILDNTTAVIYLKDIQVKYIFINRQYQDLFHITKEEIVGKTDYDIFPKEMADEFQKNDRKVLESRHPLEFEEIALHDDGPHTYISMKFPLFDSNGIPYAVCGISTDITERKKAEETLQQQKKALEQKNIALNEILGQIELEKKHIKDKVIANAENLLLPVIQRLRLKGESRKYVQLLKENIQELTSSFGIKLTEKRAKLTSREIEICNMIKNGLTNKEIAGLVNISQGTIERHRANIRKKLGLIKKDINLSSFLRTL